jgi:SAM-dependent methyltransferase
MEQVSCDFCGEREYTTVTRQTDILHRTTDEVFTIVSCNRCGLHYLNPRPTRGEIGRYYAEQYSFHAAPSRFKLLAADILDAVANSPLHWLFCCVPYLNRKLSARVKPRIADPVLRHLAPGTQRRILDIGCGSGLSAHFWGYRGSLQYYRRVASVCGVEVDDDARRVLGDSGIQAFRSIDDIPAAERFDVIRMNWSLEHVHSPASYFRFIAAHLADGGKAIVAVPNYDGLLYRIARDCVEVPIHLYHFRRQDVLNYADKFGLALAEFQSFSYPQMFVVAAQACAALPGALGASLGLHEARQLQRLLSKFDALGLGNDMVAILERKA